MMFDDMPVVGPVTAECLRQYLAHSEPPRPTQDELENMLARLAVVLKDGKLSADEAHIRLDIYWKALRDLPLASLHVAFRKLVETATFFPSIAEIREAARGGAVGRFTARRNTARVLVLKHERQWTPPVEEINEAQKVAASEMVSAVSKGMAA